MSEVTQSPRVADGDYVLLFPDGLEVMTTVTDGTRRDVCDGLIASLAGHGIDAKRGFHDVLKLASGDMILIDGIQPGQYTPTGVSAR